MTCYSHGYCSYGPGQAQLQICVFQISLSHHVMHSAGLTVWPPRAQLDQYLTMSWSLLVELFYWNAIIFDAMSILHHAGFHRVHAFLPLSDFSYDSLTIFTVWPLFDHFLIGVIPCSDPLTTLCCIVWPCFDCCLTFFGPTFWLSLTTLTFLIILTSMVQNHLSPQIVGNFITNIEIFWA